ncbi:MAG: Rne/Rng family ribonuclease [Alphaproteobacteria bacterium]
MSKTLLIDATHPDETRVVVVNRGRIEEYDHESVTRRPLKGNVYLAKVTRVEPSLQAAFIEYGGNRHGFLAFSEIHPDYYRIPIEDREALIAEEQRLSNRHRAGNGDESGARENGDGPSGDPTNGEGGPTHAARGDDEAQDGDSPESESRYGENGDKASDDAGLDERGEAAGARDSDLSDSELGDSNPDDSTTQAQHPDAARIDDMHGQDARPVDENWTNDGIARDEDPERADDAASSETAIEPGAHESRDGEYSNEAFGARDESAMPAEEPGAAPADENTHPTGIGDRIPRAQPARVERDETAEEIGEELRRRRIQLRRRYKIQEVIKRRQILLVQVTKEERGTKGAALTTYLSLAGRYCVLMPNTGKGGGISRKITSQKDRQRLKQVVEDLEIPEGMSLILRTAGQERTKAEVKRDYEYLIRLWEDIREQTLVSTAPAVIYEEANVVKRAVRDLYGRDVDEVVVEGEDGYKAARGFMRAMMPSHVKRVRLHDDPSAPLFHHYQVESQLDTIYTPVVQLRSGGSIVINQTEALVAIDVNSGRATRERNIEETATKTNLEAAEEVGRQLRLRDLAGLIVIDFIDMEDNRNIQAVERKLKDAVKDDRARIQIGRISQFGLLEMSRQRLRSSVVETSTERCRACNGTGLVRSAASSASQIMRAVEEEGLKRRAAAITLTVPTRVALHMLNQSRKALAQVEIRGLFDVTVATDDHLVDPPYRVEVTRVREAGAPEPVRITRQPSPSVEDDTAEFPEDDAFAADDRATEGAETVHDAVSDAPREGRTEGTQDRPAGAEDGASSERHPRRGRRRRRGGRGRDDRPGEGRSRQPGVPGDAPTAEPHAIGDVAAGGIDDEGAAPIAMGEGSEYAQSGQDSEGLPRAGEPHDPNAPQDGKRRRRRGRRGGRRRRRNRDGTEGAPEARLDMGQTHDEASPGNVASDIESDDDVIDAGPPPEGWRPRHADDSDLDAVPITDVDRDDLTAQTPAPQLREPAEEYRPSRSVEILPAESRVGESSVAEALTPAPERPAPRAAEAPQAPAQEPSGPSKRGWWNRLTS